MDDDLNTAQAMAVLFDLSREVNRLLNSGERVSGTTLGAIDGLFRSLGEDVLGILPERTTAQNNLGLEAQLIQALINVRAEARARKDWTTADAVRNELARIGIALDDRPDGTTWRLTQ